MTPVRAHHVVARSEVVQAIFRLLPDEPAASDLHRADIASPPPPSAPSRSIHKEDVCRARPCGRHSQHSV